VTLPCCCLGIDEVGSPFAYGVLGGDVAQLGGVLDSVGK
jgi:hypothetical protein